MYVTQTLLFLHFLLASGCRGLRCFTCLSPGGACDPEKTIIFQCPEQEVQCVDVQVAGSFVAASDITLKGCREFTCSTDLSFSTQKSSVSVRCCEGSLCNDQVVHDRYTQYNGLECYSCNTVNGEGCAEEEVTTTPCCGPLTTCIDVTGTNVDGCLSLDCSVCNDLSDNSCSGPSSETCTGNKNCSEVSFFAKAGNQEEKRMVKSCEMGSAINSLSLSSAFGIRIVALKKICDSSMCNKEDTKLSPPNEPAASPGGLQCYSCLSTNKSHCSTQSADKVQCPTDLNNCYEAEGNLTIGGSSLAIFVKQCSSSPTVSPIVIADDSYRISLDATFCTENLCNVDLMFPPEPTTAAAATEVTTNSSPSITSEVTTDNPTEVTTEVTEVFDNSTSGQPVPATTSGLGRTHPCYSAVVILIIIGSFL
ncbi:uncharacterized protein [Engystomops pustulosus]|uniref:uncharacterized protein n=1 Tax=Engystomops pustulosus TaxID=76066 RepID=UPI003AFB3C1A